jgi:hypothetical protein
VSLAGDHTWRTTGVEPWTSPVMCIQLLKVPHSMFTDGSHRTSRTSAVAAGALELPGQRHPWTN